MNKLIISIFIFILAGCQTDTNVRPKTQSFEPFPAARFDFQKTHTPVYLGEEEKERQANSQFLFNQGLSSYIDKLPKNPDWRTLDAQYRNKDLNSMTENQRQLYRQVASIFILRNHELLANKEEKEKISYYTNEYVESGGNSAGLLNYSIQVLGDNLSNEKKNFYINSVVKRSTELTNKLSKVIIMKELMEKIDPKADSIRQVHIKNVQALIKDEKESCKNLNSILN